MLDNQAATAILRKSKCTSITDLDRDELDYWKNAYDEFLLGIEGTSFGSVVFDYDGTLCDLNERFNGPPREIYQQIVRLLRGGIIVGIATGRGQSVRTDLQLVIPKKYWERVIIGYYNGSDIAPLSDNNHPIKSEPLDEDLQVIQSLLDDRWQFRKIAKYECRPKQITVEPISAALWKEAKWLSLDIIKKSKLSCVQILESSHSIDIIAPGVSKKKLVALCEAVAYSRGNTRAAFGCFDFGNSARAADRLREEISGRSVLERTAHLDESGRVTGPRVVFANPESSETETTITWTSGSRLYLLRGPSLRYALLFERSRAWANDSFCVPVPRINLTVRRSPTKG